MAKVGMIKQFGNHIEVRQNGKSFEIHIKETTLTTIDTHTFKCLLNEAIRLCDVCNKEQALKDHPLLFADETD